jgi:hypothetical protein
MNLKPYEIVTENTWRAAGQPVRIWVQYKNVPIEHLGEAKRLLRARGLTFRVRYRGTRSSVLDTRCHSRRMQDCLKRFADRATIYIQG